MSDDVLTRPLQFRVAGISWLAFACGLGVDLLIFAIPAGRESAMLGYLCGVTLALFAIPGFVSVVTWYASRKSANAAATAFVITTAFLITAQAVGQLRRERERHSDPQPQSALPINIKSSNPPRDMVDQVAEEMMSNTGGRKARH